MAFDRRKTATATKRVIKRLIERQTLRIDTFTADQLLDEPQTFPIVLSGVVEKGRVVCSAEVSSPERHDQNRNRT